MAATTAANALTVAAAVKLTLLAALTAEPAATQIVFSTPTASTSAAIVAIIAPNFGGNALKGISV